MKLLTGCYLRLGFGYYFLEIFYIDRLFASPVVSIGICASALLPSLIYLEASIIYT